MHQHLKISENIRGVRSASERTVETFLRSRERKQSKQSKPEKAAEPFPLRKGLQIDSTSTADKSCANKPLILLQPVSETEISFLGLLARVF